MKNELELAPILLFVYNRPLHTEKTLEALKAGKLSDKSILYIICDGPKIGATEEDLVKIYSVRNVIRKKKWCREVIIKERSENLGLAESVIQGVSEVIKIHGSVIALEDDILVGLHFLKFMNEGLTCYKGEKKVFGISGYKYPSLKPINKSTYFLPISSSWSFATWKDRWDIVNFNGAELLEIVEHKNLIEKINFGGNRHYQMLKDQISGKNQSWAIRFYISMFLENRFFLYPNKSLITNMGFDGSGVHCGVDNYYSKSLLTNKEINVVKERIQLDEKIVSNVEKSFEFNFRKKQSLLTKVLSRLRNN